MHHVLSLDCDPAGRPREFAFADPDEAWNRFLDLGLAALREGGSVYLYGADDQLKSYVMRPAYPDTSPVSPEIMMALAVARAAVA